VHAYGRRSQKVKKLCENKIKQEKIINLEDIGKQKREMEVENKEESRVSI
jgi:hypothetical protein